jgi:hypothetical protein
MRQAKTAARLVGCTLAALSAAGAVVLTIGAFGDRHIALGRVGVGVMRGRLVMVWASSPMIRDEPVWIFPSNVRFNTQPTRTYLPSAFRMTGMPGPLTDSIAVVYIPLISALPVMLAAAGGLMWLGRRPRTGECTNCSYDLTGLTTPRCPECGAAAPQVPQVRPRGNPCGSQGLH